MPPAVQKVLDTPELFELILLQCDLRSLLTRALRVSHKWYDVIRSSPTIQEALFFRPSQNIDGSEFTFNPILVEDFGLFFDGEVHTRQSFDALPIAKGGKKGRRESFMRKGASWRSMLVRQPPIRTMGHWCWETSWGHLVDTGNFYQPTLSDFCCPDYFDLCENCREFRAAGPDRRDLNLTMGMLYDEGVKTGISRAFHFTFFWNPKAQTSFAFAGGPDDQDVYTDHDETGEPDWEHPKLLSDVAKEVDLIQAVELPGSCIMGGGLSKSQLDFKKRYEYPR